MIVDEVAVVTMPSQLMITDLADRIEMAYARRSVDLIAIRADQGVWEVAAAALLILQSNDTSLPIDPELYVAVQPRKQWSDPWGELTGQTALLRYRREVRRIVAQLREEIKEEMTYARRRFLRGISTSKILAESTNKISALGRYILACRAGLSELAERLRPEAERQHRSCPLYRQACRGLIGDTLYPLPRSTNHVPGMVIPAGVELPSFSMN